MPVVLNQIPNLLSDNLKESFKKNEKENYENNLTPTVKQVLTANIEYEEAPNHSNSTLNTLQAKYIVLKPNQLPLHQATNGKSLFSLNLSTLTTQFLYTHHCGHSARLSLCFRRSSVCSLLRIFIFFSFFLHATFTDILLLALAYAHIHGE